MMRVCLICVEIFAWGKYGGFGRATRLIGRELAKRGVEVFAVVPRREGQKPVEQLDGITVLSYPRYFPLAATQLFRQCNADVFHSCEPSFSTYLAMRAFPDRAHAVTIRDPRDFADWKMEYDLPTLGKHQVLANMIFEDLLFSRQAVRRADAVFCPAKCLIDKVTQKYQLTTPPRFLPTPVHVPEHVQKAQIPTVSYMARWDRRKRPELFLQLAKEFPDVQFICAGNSRDKKWDSYLRNKYSHLPNLEMPGFVDQFSSNAHSTILEKSWIMVNTSKRESLPNSFIEASSYGCAILSAVNPDGFASELGYHVLDDRFDEGLRKLLANNLWKEQGERGRRYIQEHFELNRAMDNHMTMYQQLMKDCGVAHRNESLPVYVES